jgi:dipeptidyl aminopeptidase/acylaminoacyl peptidase
MALSFLDGLKNIDPVATVADHFKGKLLLLQGDTDASIAVSESSRYVHAALKAGIETVSHVLRNADHNYASVSHFKAVCSTVTSWAKERFL